MGYVFAALAIYLIFRFVGGFVIPVLRVSSQMRKQFKGMAEKRQQPDSTPTNSGNGKQRTAFNIEGDYIPFEEVK